MKVWLNGEIRDSSAAIDAGDRGFLLGDGAFETLYVEKGRPAFLAEHLARLRFGLGVLQIPAPAALASLGDIIRRLAAETNLQEKASARITVTRGSGRRGLAFPSAEEASPTLLVTLSPFPPQQTASIKLHLTQRRR
ncbi:MAG TPA: aminotransferase class IV, partial [Parvularculaceae bacterium]|nr:aminotransferase class IV [Parvularculaceae bacterium]